jgi:hypothetical protein
MDRDKFHDTVIEDSFPASDPPAWTGITGVGTNAERCASHVRGIDARPTGTPTHDRHAMEIAHQWESDQSADVVEG